MPPDGIKVCETSLLVYILSQNQMTTWEAQHVTLSSHRSRICKFVQILILELYFESQLTIERPSAEKGIVHLEVRDVASDEPESKEK